jgi:hypothetical protein
MRVIAAGVFTVLIIALVALAVIVFPILFGRRQ